MKSAALMLAAAMALTAAADDATPKPLTPAEAVKKVNEKVTVELEVKSVGGKDATYLNSEADFKDDKNFTVYIPKGALPKFKAAKIDGPGDHFKGERVRVTGTVTLYRDKPQIKVEEPDQIKVVEKK